MDHIAGNLGAGDDQTLAQAIVDTVREPILILDADLRVVIASRAFYLTFQTDQESTKGQLLYKLGSGRWNIPSLRERLAHVTLNEGAAEDDPTQDLEVSVLLPPGSPRTMLLNARKVFRERSASVMLLLSFTDVTDRRQADTAMATLLQQKAVLVEEVQHRVANSLQIIASIMLMKERSVASAETRQHLEDARNRVMSVAAVQRHLQASTDGEAVQMTRYLTDLCDGLAASMIDKGRPITLGVEASGSLPSSHAVSLGLIVTELVINALKHAFPDASRPGRIKVSYEVDGSDWRLSVADDGIGKPDFGPEKTRGGLGTSIVKALAQQLDATIDVVSNAQGTTIALVHATFSAALPRAA